MSKSYYRIIIKKNGKPYINKALSTIIKEYLDTLGVDYNDCYVRIVQNNVFTDVDRI